MYTQWLAFAEVCALRVLLVSTFINITVYYCLNTDIGMQMSRLTFGGASNIF